MSRVSQQTARDGTPEWRKAGTGTLVRFSNSANICQCRGLMSRRTVCGRAVRSTCTTAPNVFFITSATWGTVTVNGFYGSWPKKSTHRSASIERVKWRNDSPLPRRLDRDLARNVTRRKDVRSIESRITRKTKNKARPHTQRRGCHRASVRLTTAVDRSSLEYRCEMSLERDKNVRAKQHGTSGRTR